MTIFTHLTIAAGSKQVFEAHCGILVRIGTLRRPKKRGRK